MGGFVGRVGLRVEVQVGGIHLDVADVIGATGSGKHLDLVSVDIGILNCLAVGYRLILLGFGLALALRALNGVGLWRGGFVATHCIDATRTVAG